jgi:hypothetical protein
MIVQIFKALNILKNFLDLIKRKYIIILAKVKIQKKIIIIFYLFH